MIKRVFGSTFEELVEKEVQRRVEQRMDEFYERKLTGERFERIEQRLGEIELKLFNHLDPPTPVNSTYGATGSGIVYTDCTTCKNP